MKKMIIAAAIAAGLGGHVCHCRRSRELRFIAIAVGDASPICRLLCGLGQRVL